MAEKSRGSSTGLLKIEVVHDGKSPLLAEENNLMANTDIVKSKNLQPKFSEVKQRFAQNTSRSSVIIFLYFMGTTEMCFADAMITSGQRAALQKICPMQTRTVEDSELHAVIQCRSTNRIREPHALISIRNRIQWVLCTECVRVTPSLLQSDNVSTGSHWINILWAILMPATGTRRINFSIYI